MRRSSGEYEITCRGLGTSHDGRSKFCRLRFGADARRGRGASGKRGIGERETREQRDRKRTRMRGEGSKFAGCSSPFVKSIMAGVVKPYSLADDLSHPVCRWPRSLLNKRAPSRAAQTCAGALARSSSSAVIGVRSPDHRPERSAPRSRGQRQEGAESPRGPHRGGGRVPRRVGETIGLEDACRRTGAAWPAQSPCARGLRYFRPSASRPSPCGEISEFRRVPGQLVNPPDDEPPSGLARLPTAQGAGSVGGLAAARAA